MHVELHIVQSLQHIYTTCEDMYNQMNTSSSELFVHHWCQTIM